MRPSDDTLNTGPGSRQPSLAEGNQRNTQRNNNKTWTLSSIAACVFAVMAAVAVLLIAIPATREIGIMICTLLAMGLLLAYVHNGWFRPLEQMSYCCLPQTTQRPTCAKKTMIRMLLVILLALDISTYSLEGVLTTRNGSDPHPFQNFVANLLGSTLFMFLSLWFVDGFFLVLRVSLWILLHHTGCGKNGDTKQKTDEENSINSSEPNEQQQQHRALKVRGVDVTTEWLVEKQQKLRFPCTVGLFVILLSTGLATGFRTPRTQRVEIVMSHLPACLDGFTLGILADLHAGPTVGRTEIAQHVARMNALAPEAILVVGDVVDGTVQDIASLVEPMQDLRAPYGVYFSVGNHEHYYRPDEWREWANETAGWAVLHNTMTRLEYNNTTASNDTSCVLEIAGVDDAEGEPDYAAAFSNHTPGLPLVLMAHQPIQVLDAQKEAQSSGTDLDLILSGHTHGGQLWPLHSFATLSQKYIAGLYRFDQESSWLHLYVTQGVVGWGPRMRFGARTEYSLLTLRSPEVVGMTPSDGKRADGASRGAFVASTFGWVCIGISALVALRVIVRNLPCYLCYLRQKQDKSREEEQRQQVTSEHPRTTNDSDSAAVSA